MFNRSPITSHTLSKPIIRPQALTYNSYINIASEDNFIHVNNLHHVFIKINLVYIRTRPHLRDLYHALHHNK